MFTNSILLITGGTGSFGNAVLNKFLDSDISEIRIFSRDEKKQHDMRVEFDNPKINSVLSSNLAEFLDNFNSEDERVFNKITFKNFINNFFEIYAG